MAGGGNKSNARQRALVAYKPPHPAGKLSGVRARGGWLLPAGVQGVAAVSVRILLRVVIAVTFLVLLGFVGLYTRLSYAPISMTYLVPPIERAVNRALTGMHFDIGDAVLRTSPSGFGIEFRLTDVSLVDEGNNRIVESPLASADVSFRALLRGRLAVGEVALIGPRLFLQYSEDKGLALSFGDPRDSKSDLRNPKNDSDTTKIAAVHGADNGEALAGGQVTRSPAPRADIAASSTTARGSKARFNPHASVRAINLTKAFNDLFSLMRRGESAYLGSFGIRDATIYFDRGDQITTWELPAVQINLEHAGKNSTVNGHVAVRTEKGEWRLRFNAKQNLRNQQLALSMSVNDVVPHAIANDFPAITSAKALKMPVSVRADIDLGSNGDILSAEIQAAMKAGEFFAPWDNDQKHPAVIDSGQFRVKYSREAGRIDFSPMELRFGNAIISMSGLMERQPASGHWGFRFASDKLALGAEQFGVPVIPLDQLTIQGDFDPRLGVTTFERILLQAADAKINLAGTITQGARSPGIQMTGQISPMPAAFVKLIWPPFVSYGAREWIGKRVPAGKVGGGVVRVDIPIDMLANEGSMIPASAVDVRVDLEDLEIHYLGDLPPMFAPRATASFAGQRFFLTLANASIPLPSGDHVDFTDGEFIVGDLRPRFPDGEIHFKTQSNAKAILELLDQPPLHYVRALNMKVPEVGGTATGTFSIALPLIKDVKFKDVKLNGRVHHEDVRATNLPGGFGIHGGKVDFDVSEKAIEARGDIKVNGMMVGLAWQRIFDATPDQQPPLRVRTVLDEDARNELGIEVNHVLRGPVVAEASVSFRKNASPVVRVGANLTNSEILMTSLGWRKAAGARAELSVDVETANDGSTALRNLVVQGDDLSIRGEVLLNDKRKPVSFALPEVSLNSQTKMDLRGELASNNVWRVRVTAPSYDGRQFFRSLFSAGKLTDDQPTPPKNDPGIDVSVQMDNVIGFFDTTAKNVILEAKRRNNKLIALDLHGRLNDEPMAARIESKEGEPRLLLLEARDAGAAFRLIGLYPSARGGRASMKVNLDGSGVADKIGVLYARDFVVVNNPVIGEVLSGSKKNGARKVKAQAAAQNAPQPSYERIDFEKMLIQFAVGSGQFVLREGVLHGPMMGVTLRGNIDFKRERLKLSGTYTPAFGLTGAFNGVPLFGELFGGREGEGIFGLTFNVEGPTTNPDVQVNPLSMFTPGFTRQLMEFDQTEPHIIPPDKPAAKRGSSDARSSGASPVTR